MNITNITFPVIQNDIPQQTMNMDYTWDEIIMYYYYLFMYISCSSAYIYFVIWVQNRLMGRDLSFINETDGESGSASETETETETENEKTNILYENEMFEEYDNLEDRDLTEEYVKDLSLNTITETTPRGDVLTYYDSELESFVYYSKTKEIPYKYLETVARKYVIKYDCKRIYIDIRKEYEKGVNKYKDIKEKANTEQTGADTEPSGANKRRQLFVKLKSYNRKAEVNSKHKDKIYILREKSNRYSYRGKIEEYKEPVSSECENTNETDSTEPTIDKKTIDFSAFKKFKNI